MYLTPSTSQPADDDVFEHWFNQAQCLRTAAEALREYVSRHREENSATRGLRGMRKACYDGQATSSSTE